MLRSYFPAFYMPELLDDPHRRTRTVPMKVICAGLSRTGTTSLARALEQLGFGPVYTGFGTWQSTLDREMINRGYDAKYRGKGELYGREEFDQVFGHHSSIAAIPGYLNFEELAAAYPDAKVILTHRDVEAWKRSMDTMFELAPEYPSVSERLWSLIDSPNSNLQSIIWRMCEFYGWPKTFNQQYPRVYKDHCERVRQTVPVDRLLEYQVQEGWEPLCEFLGVPVPETSFPTANSGEDLRAAFAKWRKMRLEVRLRRLAALVGIIGVVGWMLGRQGIARSWMAVFVDNE